MFTLTIEDTVGGSYTFELKDQLDHHTAGDQTETLLTLDLSGAIVGYDEDGDQLTLDSGSLQIMVQDDIPSQTTGIAQGYVEEEALGGGNQDTSDITGIDGDSAYNTNNAVW